jgi:hypothetical protein
MHATCLADLILLNFTCVACLVKCLVKCRFTNCESSVVYNSVASPLGSKYLCEYRVFNKVTPNLFFDHRVRDEVRRPYKAAGKIEISCCFWL